MSEAAIIGPEPIITPQSYPEIEVLPSGLAVARAAGALAYRLPDHWVSAPGTFTGCNIHWTAGGPTPNAEDRDHYHFLVDQAGRVSRGNIPLTGRRPWAGHTRGFNTGRVGVSLCGMAGAVQGGPYGKYPLTGIQWEAAAAVVAEILVRGNLPVTYNTCIQHGEVQAVLGIAQRGKWDVLAAPWDRALDRQGPQAVCRDFRLRVMKYHAQFRG